MATPRFLGTKRIAFGSVAVAAALTTAFGPTAMAGPSPDAPPKVTMLDAMQRDLGLDATAAKARMADEAAAARTDRSLRDRLGTDYAGSWYDAKAGSLVVAVTGDSAAAEVEAAGAKARTVERSAAQLGEYVDRLDAADAPAQVASWYADVKTNKVVIATRDVDAATTFAADAGVPASAVTAAKTVERPQPLDQGGDAYYSGPYRCSIGFAVQGGFVTAGHCGSAGDTTSEPSGTFEGSSFPGNDYAFVATSSPVSGTVNDWAGGSVAVRGSSDAAIGSSICRSGSTTGWHCGTIQARGATVNYAEGSVSGLIRTTVCAEPGDSGGSAISGNQAQGVTSGGSGDCTWGGTTFFQPVNEILNAYGLSLTTS